MPQNAESSATRQRRLDALVTQVAAEFMSASAANLPATYERTLQILLEFFDVDTSFLRRNEVERGVTVLVSEWPRRPHVPDPDPLGEVPFEVDPVFAATRDLREPFVLRPDDSGDAYQERVEEGSGVSQVSMAMVPLLRNGTTSGVLGFIKFGDRAWDVAETNALQAVASLIVQVQARVSAEEELHFRAYHDELTSLPNRRALLDELDRRFAAEEPSALLFLDLDRFKGINDSLGHGAGDRLLEAVAARLDEATGGAGRVFRLAGDEFVVLTDDEDPVGHAALADRLLDGLRAPIAVTGHEIACSASIGVAVSWDEGTIGDQLLGHADVALRAAKAAGGDRAIFFDEQLRQAAHERSGTEIELRRAIRNGELRLHYQPEIDLRTGALLGTEALVRWEHPLRGLLPAYAFIQVAEETGLSVDLGAWVTAEACRQAAVWRREHPDREFLMRVNLSPAQLATRNIVQLVAENLAANDLPGRALCFEITEHAVLQDVERAVQILHELKDLGVRLAIDDFGTGYSSMAQLKRLPVDVLKVDQSFVAGLAADGGDRAIVDATIRLSRAFGLEVVAEGIETPDMVEALLRLGCNRGQGYLLGRPASPADLADLLAAGAISRLQLALDPTQAPVPTACG